MITKTFPEPMIDIAAQIGAVCDDAHPKHSAFIAAGNAFVVTRECGTLVTRNPYAADFFQNSPTVTDDDMAALLGYPETKASAIGSGNFAMVQALDGAGAVVMESVTSMANVQAVADDYRKYGKINVCHPIVAGFRRLTHAMGIE